MSRRALDFVLGSGRVRHAATSLVLAVVLMQWPGVAAARFIELGWTEPPLASPVAGDRFEVDVLAALDETGVLISGALALRAAGATDLVLSDPRDPVYAWQVLPDTGDDTQAMPRFTPTEVRVQRLPLSLDQAAAVVAVISLLLTDD